MRRTLGPLLLALFTVLPGCVQTASLPARQLAPKETVISGGVHLAAPYGVYGQVTRHLGEGDVSANVGLSSQYLSGGLAARRYVYDRLNAETQVRLAGNRSFSALLAVAGLQTVPTETMPLYFGIHAGTRAWTGGRPNEETSSRFALPGEGLDPLLGGSVGIGRVPIGQHWRMQFELEFTANLGMDAPGDELNLLPAPNRFSIGVSRSLN